MPGPMREDEEMYRDVNDTADVAETAADDAEAKNGRTRASVARRSNPSRAYEAWTVAELRRHARDLGLTGYSRLSKDKLIDTLRDY
jgi:hypothetical protein